MVPMRRQIITAILTVILVTASAHAVDRDVSQPAEILFKAHSTGKKIPVLSLQFPGLDESFAYNVQKIFVEKYMKEFASTAAGFKAGLTSTRAMKRFGRKTPVAGVLFTSGDATRIREINRGNYRVLMMETEIGFIVERVILRPLEDAAELKRYIRYAVPVIELPEMGFVQMEAVKGPDIIAANVGSAGYVLGKKKKIHDLDLNAVEVTVSRNNEVVNTGIGSDAMGDQWQAALWLANTMIKNGWEIQPGHILITGALGKMVPAKPGSYIADYGSFGIIRVEVK